MRFAVSVEKLHFELEGSDLPDCVVETCRKLDAMFSGTEPAPVAEAKKKSTRKKAAEKKAEEEKPAEAVEESAQPEQTTAQPDVEPSEAEELDQEFKDIVGDAPASSSNDRTLSKDDVKKIVFEFISSGAEGSQEDRKKKVFSGLQKCGCTHFDDLDAAKYMDFLLHLGLTP